MTGESFEYAIKKDVRNNPIVREVDRERHREMWRSVSVGVFLVAVLVFSVWRQVELLWHGYELDDLRADRAAEEQANQRLRLEKESLRSLSRIERLATHDLRMIVPGPDDQGVIERVIPDSPPPQSVVARR
jgi:cell division protein FtsL